MLQAGVLGINIGDGDGVSGVVLGKLGGVLLVILSDLSEALGDLGAADEGGDVGVVAESKDILAG